VTVYLVRHAKAGSRKNWVGLDELRPLSKTGARQAAELAIVLGHCAPKGADRVISSPFLRCRQTVEPYAAAIGRTVEVADELGEGASNESAQRIIEQCGDADAVLCSHGDVIGEVLRHAARHGVALPDDRMEKGSTWILELVAGAIVEVRYLPPPA
jgi:8-oxo-dGTP diphosphatase